MHTRRWIAGLAVTAVAAGGVALGAGAAFADAPSPTPAPPSNHASAICTQRVPAALTRIDKATARIERRRLRAGLDGVAAGQGRPGAHRGLPCAGRPADRARGRDRPDRLTELATVKSEVQHVQSTDCATRRSRAAGRRDATLGGRRDGTGWVRAGGHSCTWRRIRRRRSRSGDRAAGSSSSSRTSRRSPTSWASTCAATGTACTSRPTARPALAAVRRLRPVAVVLDVGLPGHRRHRGLPRLRAERRLDAGPVRHRPRRRGRPHRRPGARRRRLRHQAVQPARAGGPGARRCCAGPSASPSAERR